MKFNGSMFKEVDFEFTLNHTSPTYLKLYSESEVQELKEIAEDKQALVDQYEKEIQELKEQFKMWSGC